MSIVVDRITKENEDVLQLPNEPFLNTGRLVPLYDGKEFSYKIEEFSKEEVTKDCFPDENYVFEEMWDGFYGLAASIEGKFVGYALFRNDYKKYLYLDNLLITADNRGKGVGTRLIEEGMKLALDLGKIGLWTVCQDNNLFAAKFYLKNGFSIGGMDTRAYEGTSKPDMSDIYFYLNSRLR